MIPASQTSNEAQQGASLLPAFAQKSPASEFLSFAAKPAGASPFAKELSRRLSERESTRAQTNDRKEISRQNNTDPHETQEGIAKERSETRSHTKENNKNTNSNKEKKISTRKARGKEKAEKIANKAEGKKENSKEAQKNIELVAGAELALRGAGQKGKDSDKGAGGSQDKLSSAKLIEAVLQKEGGKKTATTLQEQEDKKQFSEILKKDSLLESLQNKKAKEAFQKDLAEKIENTSSQKTDADLLKNQSKHIDGDGKQAAKGEALANARWEIEDHRPQKESSDVPVNRLEAEALKEATEGASKKRHKGKSFGQNSESREPSGAQGILREGASSKEGSFQISNPQETKEIQQKNRAAMERLVERARIQIRSDGSSQASIRLNPRLLGNLTLHIKLEQNVLQGQVFVENKAAHKLIKQELEFLKQELHRQGIQVESLQLRLREPGQSNFSFQGQDDPKGQSGLQQGQSGQNGSFGQNKEAFSDAEFSPALFGHATAEREYDTASLVLDKDIEGIDIRI